MIRIGVSDIHGKGVFAEQVIPMGSVISIRKLHGCEEDDGGLLPLIMGMIVRFGGFNHSCVPNIRILETAPFYVQAIRDVPEGEELVLSYLQKCSMMTCNCSKCK